MKLVRFASLEAEAVTHDPAIRKRVWLRQGDVPRITQCAQARLQAGQVATGHVHADMVEVFIVQRGRGSVVVDGTRHTLGEGDCAVVEPGERHELCNDSADELWVTTLGVIAG